VSSAAARDVGGVVGRPRSRKVFRSLLEL